MSGLASRAGSIIGVLAVVVIGPLVWLWSSPAYLLARSTGAAFVLIVLGGWPAAGLALGSLGALFVLADTGYAWGGIAIAATLWMWKHATIRTARTNPVRAD